MTIKMPNRFPNYQYISINYKWQHVFCKGKVHQFTNENCGMSSSGSYACAYCSPHKRGNLPATNYY